MGWEGGGEVGWGDGDCGVKVSFCVWVLGLGCGFCWVGKVLGLGSRLGSDRLRLRSRAWIGFERLGFGFGFGFGSDVNLDSAFDPGGAFESGPSITPVSGQE